LTNIKKNQMNKASLSTKTATSRATPKVKAVRKAAPKAAEPEPTPVVEATPVAEPAPVETPAAQESESPSFRQRLETLIQAQQSHMLVLKAQVQELRKLQREHEQLVKDASRKNKKKKLPRDFTKPRRSTGFAEPVVVSDELYSFLVKTKATMKDSSFTPSNQEEHDNWPRVPVKAGSPVARTDVTSHISRYIKEHNLQNPNERREIVPDAALKKIFSEPVEPSKSDASKKVYTYLKLQKYVNHHFPSRKTEASA
jgi:hypothetical protein